MDKFLKMQTQTYKNWFANTQACGLTNEQSCGLAMLLAWSLTGENIERDGASKHFYWEFVEQDDFNEIIQTAFTTDDFLKIIPILKIAGETLRVEMPPGRLDGHGEIATSLDLRWEHEPIDIASVGGDLWTRHTFDLNWCQEIGESLRTEIRAPIFAYVFASYVAQGFSVFDPEGFPRIVLKVLEHPSPLVRAFCSRSFAIETKGLEGHEPFQIVLLGFFGGELAEHLWNIQKVLFYRQPGGEPFNLEKQFAAPTEFLEFSLDLISAFVEKNRSYCLEVGRLVSSEFLFSGAGSEPFDQFLEHVKSRYGVPAACLLAQKTTALLSNVINFYTFCCFKLRNLSNRIDELPTFRMLDDTGLLWARDLEQKSTLLDEAIKCFDIMLSWRFGESWALFVQTDDDFIQRVYIGDSSGYKPVDELFSIICQAYAPKCCVIAFWTHGAADDGGFRNEVFFLSLRGDSVPRADVFKGMSSVEAGRYLGEYLGSYENLSLIENYFPETCSSFMRRPKQEVVEASQNRLLEMVPSFSAWNFVSRLKKIWSSESSVTYADVEDISCEEGNTSMWLLIDYLAPQVTSEGQVFRSAKIRSQYDCRNKTRKFLAMKMFELNMGSGACVYSSSELTEEASPVPPVGTVGYEAWQLACQLNCSDKQAVS